MAGYYGRRGATPENTNNKRKKSYHGKNVDISTKTSKGISKKKHTIIQILSMVMAVIFLISGGALCYASSIINSLGDADTIDDGKNYSVDDDRGNGVISDNNLLADKDVLNVMLFGQDNKDSEGDNGRSDSMILLSIDVLNEQIKLTSFLRDTYVYIPSGDSNEGWNKLNAAYNYGGAKLTVKTIESNFGIQIDRYAIVDFNGFKDIIDALGGITIPITGNEARYINAQIDYNNQKCDHIPDKYCESIYKTDENGNYVYDRNGEKDEETQDVKLNGQQALWYARNRGSDEISDEVFSGSDWDRTDRQRKVIKALIDEFKNASFTKLVSAVEKVGPMVQTNFKPNEITSLLTSALTIMKYPMYQFNIPIGEASDPDKLWKYETYILDGRESEVVEITDWEKTRTQLANFVFKKVTSKEYKISD